MAAGPPFIKIPKVPPIEAPRVKLETGRTAPMQYSDLMRTTEQRAKLPGVNEVGKSLIDRGFGSAKSSTSLLFNSSKAPGRILQSGNSSRNIAVEVAASFGYEPYSAEEIANAGINDRATGQVDDSRPTYQSDAYLLVRESKVRGYGAPQFSVEIRGKEYNYGPGNREGAVIVDRIPLRQVGKFQPRSPGSFSKYAAAEKTILERVMPRSKIASTKVVDENGVPKRVYTGSQSAYDHADPSKYGEKTRYVTGMNFSESPAVASLYSTGRFSLRETPSDAAPNVRPSYLDIKNEFDMQRLYGRDEFLPEVLDKLRETKMPERYWSRKLTGDQMFMMFGSNEEFKASLIKSGYDGVTHVSDVPGMEVHRVWVPFTTDQIHPAILTESQRTELFKKLTGLGISAIVAAAMVAGRDAGDTEDVPIVKRRSSDPLLRMMGR